MLVLRPKTKFDISVEAEITPELATKNLKEIENFQIYCGNRTLKLKDLFEISKQGDEKKILLEGDFSKVKYIGFGMDGGEIIVKGNVGTHCGALMKNGKIVIEGNADDWLGAEMKGGEIIVKGNAANLVGSAYYGDLAGMSGGKILIEGNAGNYIGDKMTGGIIEIKGDAGDFIGTEMRGGQIIIHGSCGFVGSDMRGGEIIIKGNFELLPSFVEKEGFWIGDVNVKGEGKIKKLQ
ncbi:MAG: formylmethanofuran dehydrogenase subunit C [Archaeoglobaceae archaeon]|nr:formylmethanofuran dehydrogenase subunit C [Archaeoglobaceae archaeon]MCX8151666.1 formylmethanofuran dehydrogenase subunit C [Archaeoglobaceae archaeon]MDW8013056.1 formylmethanofuran dehydrogenase subunit C [Archaeoglobaceae archaeon]